MRENAGIATDAVEPETRIAVPDAAELARQFAATGERSTPPMPDATLTLTRNAPDDVQDRTVTFWLDNERWDSLRYGREMSRQISPGPHRLRAHNTLLSTTFDFEARPGEQIRLRCANAVSRGGALMMLIIGWAAMRVRIERDAA